LIEEKDLDGAWAILERAVADGARGEERLALVLRKAKVLDRRKDLDGCVDLLEKIIKEAPGYVPALISLAGIETNLGRFDEAEARYRTVLKSDPASAEALQGLQNLKLQKLAREKEGGAGKSRDEGSVLAALEKKAEEHLAQGELLAAREVLGNLLRRSSAARERKYRLKAMRELAGVEEKLGRLAEAESYLERLLELEPGDAEAWRQMADFQLRRLNQRESAQRHYERYLSLLPEGKEADPKVYFNLGSLLSKTQPELAISYFERALRAGFEDPQIHRSLGYLYTQTRQWEKSLEAFNRYLEPSSGANAAEREALRTFIKENVLPRLEDK
jgi:tetratricopeptide (TPR) repeat protein